MFRAEPFHEDHGNKLLEEPMNKGLLSDCFDGYLTALRVQTVSRTFFVNDEIVCVAGITHMWAGRGYLWMILSENIKKYPVQTYRGLRSYLKSLPYNRVEMDVPVKTEFDDRRARFMGFKLECPFARSYSPSGEDRALYAWVRD